MLSVNRIRHTKLSCAVVLNKRIKAAAVHICLKNYLTVCNVIAVYLDNSYMVSVRRRMEKIQSALIHNKIRTRLAVSHQYRSCPFSAVQIVICKNPVSTACIGFFVIISLSYKIIRFIVKNIYRVFPYCFIFKTGAVCPLVRLCNIFPGYKILAFYDRGEISAVST